MSRAVGQLERLSRAHGGLPHMRFSAAFSDGDALWAVRYASDDQAPTLYYRFSDSRNGFAVVSEPLELDQSGWQEVPAGQAVRIDRAGGCERMAFCPA